MCFDVNSIHILRVYCYTLSVKAMEGQYIDINCIGEMTGYKGEWCQAFVVSQKLRSGKGGLVKPDTGMKVIQEQVWLSRL